MKIPMCLARAAIAGLFLLGGISGLQAEIKVLLSVKFILKPDGTRPDPGDVGTPAGFNAEVARGNRILEATARGYRIQVVEYLDIRPGVPVDEPSDYWFNLYARDNRPRIETTALTTPAVWRWNASAINIYVNNSSSGACSFVGGGLSISLGKDVGLGTVLHELGHFFNLSHTHAGDPSCANPPPYFVANGDNLAATIDDHNCLSRDSLSMSNYQGRAYSALDPLERARVNSSWLNVMSYHEEDQLLGEQMDLWTEHANGARVGFCTGRTWFVAVDGSNGASGENARAPFATVSRAFLSVGGADDVVLLRTGTYTSPFNGTMNVPCTISATRGAVTIVRP